MHAHSWRWPVLCLAPDKDDRTPQETLLIAFACLMSTLTLAGKCLKKSAEESRLKQEQIESHGGLLARNIHHAKQKRLCHSGDLATFFLGTQAHLRVVQLARLGQLALSADGGTDAPQM